MPVQVAPSVLSADFLNLQQDIQMLNQSADIIHLDIMDGTFVPNISFGFPVCEAISKVASIPLDAHLMVVHPERWFGRLADMGVKMCSFHLEAAGRNTGKYIRMIHELGMQAGVAIDPDVDVKRLFPYIGKADFLLIMSVFAGFGGQKFIYESLDRITALRSIIDKRHSKTLIEVDGGVSSDNIVALKEAGIDIAVAGSSVFKSKNPVETIRTMQI